MGISNYNKAQTEEIMKIFKELHTPFIVNQPSYSMLNRWVETDGLDKFAQENGIGLAVFSFPLPHCSRVSAELGYTNLN